MSATTVINDTLDQAYEHLDRDGMLPGAWQCQRCGKQLNADGNHPAELYAGTFNGLCYPCTNGSKYVEGTRLVDGGTVWNYPPHLPSWRRSRETYVFFWDCEQCHGEGVRPSWDNTARCPTCSKRAYTYGPGHDHHDYRRRALDAAQARFERRLAAHLKLPKRTSRKRRKAASLALRDEQPETFKAINDEVLAEFRRVNAAIDRRAERMGTYRVLTPEEIITVLSRVLRFA
jgi:hypothetical protein